MKKLFLTLMVVAGFVLASCAGNGLSNKNGDVSFSISADEIGRYIAASREGDASGPEPIVFEVVAQIKGSKGYYAWIRKQAVYTPQIQAIVQEGVNNTNDAGTNPSQDEIPKDVLSQFEKDLVFNFKSIPAKQTYKVMIDILIKDESVDAFSSEDSEGPDYWAVCYSGSQEDVSVVAGITNPVTVELDKVETGYYAPGNFAIKVTYNKNGKDVTEEVPFGSSKYSFSKDKDNKFWFAHSGREWYSVSALKLVFAEDSHFIDGSKFRIIANKSDDFGVIAKTNVAESQNGEIDLTSVVTSFEVKEPGYFDPKIEFESFIKDDTSLFFMQNYEFNYSSSKNNFGSYSTDYNSKFVRDTSITEHDRFRLTIPLTDILGTDPLEKGDTVVFMLNGLSVNNNGRPVSTPTVAYQLQKEGWESLTPQAKDANNTTIKFSKIVGDKVCAANFVNGDEQYFQLYIDADDEDLDEDVTELNGSVYMSYKIFPASEKVFVFHKAYEEWTQEGQIVNDYRKEMIFDLNSYFEELGKWPAKNSKITINVGGTFKTLANDTDEEIVREASLNSELDDNIDYMNCGVNGHNQYYHPLSNSSSESGENTSNFNSLHLSGDGTLGNIIFDKISQPHKINGAHKYCLQMYKSYGDSSDDSLLIIKGFSISVSVEGGSGSPDVTIVDIP